MSMKDTTCLQHSFQENASKKNRSSFHCTGELLQTVMLMELKEMCFSEMERFCLLQEKRRAHTKRKGGEEGKGFYKIV